MKFVLEIDLGAKPDAKVLAVQLYRQANLFSTASEPLGPQVWGIDDPRTMQTAGKWEIRERKTLADLAGSTGLFKRPRHAVPYCWWQDTLREAHEDGSRCMPRLTAEDLTATDWEEVVEE